MRCFYYPPKEEVPGQFNIVGHILKEYQKYIFYDTPVSLKQTF